MTVKNNSNKDQISFHVHDFSEIVLVEKGSVRHHCDNVVNDLKKGDFFLIHPGMKHAYTRMSSQAVIYNILYNPAVPIPMILLTKSPFIHLLYPRTDRENSFAGIPGNIRKQDLDRIVFFLKIIDSEERTHRPGYQTIIISIFTAVVMLLAYYCKYENALPQKWSLNTAIRMMNEHLSDTNFRIETPAGHSGMCMSTLQRKFKSIPGVPPSEYMQRLRINRAISLITGHLFTR